MGGLLRQGVLLIRRATENSQKFASKLTFHWKKPKQTSTRAKSTVYCPVTSFPCVSPFLPPRRPPCSWWNTRDLTACTSWDGLGGGGWIQVLDLRDESCFHRVRIRGSHNIPAESLARDNRWCVPGSTFKRGENQVKLKLGSLNRLVISHTSPS